MKVARLSRKGFSILKVLNKNEALYGQEIIIQTKIQSGTLYPLLVKLENAGWLKREKEKGNGNQLGRPLRIYHSLTTEGEKKLIEKKAELEEKIKNQVRLLNW